MPAVSSLSIGCFQEGFPPQREKVLCGLLPADEQAAVFHLDLHRVSQEMVAHPQGEKGGEGCTVQRVLPPRMVTPLAASPRQNREKIPASRAGKVR